MKILALLVCIGILSLTVASAEWQISENRSLGSLSGGADVREVTLRNGDLNARLTAVLFSEKALTLRVIDSPAPGATKLAAVASDAHALAGINGGYFQENHDPVGLVIADGKTLHPFQRAKLLSGVLTVSHSKIKIVRSSSFQAGPDIRQAIECGPMLVENAVPVAGLNAVRPARRTIVATDGHGRWALIYLTGVTLADSAQILSLPNLFPHATIRTALNLDGGSSSGLWANTSPTPVSLVEFGNVRNYLVLVPAP